MISEYELSSIVKEKLDAMGHNRRWLAEEIHNRTGLYCDVYYLSRLINGQRNSKRIKQAMGEILGISELIQEG